MISSISSIAKHNTLSFGPVVLNGTLQNFSSFNLNFEQTTTHDVNSYTLIRNNTTAVPNWSFGPDHGYLMKLATKNTGNTAEMYLRAHGEQNNFVAFYTVYQNSTKIGWISHSGLPVTSGQYYIKFKCFLKGDNLGGGGCYINVSTDNIFSTSTRIYQVDPFEAYYSTTGITLSSNPLAEHTTPLFTITGSQTLYIRLEKLSGADAGSFVYIDDIRVYKI